MSPAERPLPPHERIAEIVAELRGIFVLPRANLLRWVMECCDAVDPSIEVLLRQPHGGIPDEAIREAFPDDRRLAVRLREWLDDPVYSLLPPEHRPRRRRRTKGNRERERGLLAVVRDDIYSLINLFTPAKPMSKKVFARFGPGPWTRVRLLSLRSRVIPCDPVAALQELESEGGYINAQPSEERLRLGFEEHAHPWIRLRRVGLHEAVEVHSRLEEVRKEILDGKRQRTGHIPREINPPLRHLPDPFAVPPPGPRLVLDAASPPRDRALEAVHFALTRTFQLLWDLSADALLCRPWRMCRLCYDWFLPRRGQIRECSTLCEQQRAHRIRLLQRKARRPRRSPPSPAEPE